jgi:two-component system, OmpR family, osmolarity sensor histidine kinase EnvZ
MSLSRTKAARGWRTSHLLLAALLGFLLVLTTAVLLLLRYSAMQPSVRQVALPIAAVADLADAASAAQTAGALARQGIVRQAQPPDSRVVLPVPFLAALATYLREQTGRQIQIEYDEDSGTRLWLSSPHGDWIGVPLESLRTLVARFALLVILMALLLAVAAAWWLSRRLAGPIEHLASVAGRLPEPVAADEFRVQGPREVRLLGARLADALSRIEQQRRERDLLLAGLSHDLRTPLMRLLLRVDLIDAIGEVERSAIGAEISELDRRIDRFIEHARTGAEEPTVDVDLKRLLDSALEASDGRGYDWQVELPDVAWVRGQPGVLGRLLDNLMDNAEQHGSAPFMLTLERVGDQDARWLLRVENSVAAPAAERNTPTPHRGFGLALCKNIAEAHGGGLSVDQDSQRFSVELRLPQAVDASL